MKPRRHIEFSIDFKNTKVVLGYLPWSKEIREIKEYTLDNEMLAEIHEVGGTISVYRLGDISLSDLWLNKVKL